MVRRDFRGFVAAAATPFVEKVTDLGVLFFFVVVVVVVVGDDGDVFGPVAADGFSLVMLCVMFVGGWVGDDDDDDNNDGVSR